MKFIKALKKLKLGNEVQLITGGIILFNHREQIFYRDESQTQQHSIDMKIMPHILATGWGTGDYKLYKSTNEEQPETKLERIKAILEEEE